MLILTLASLITDEENVSKLPDFLESAAVYLQTVNSYQYFDYHLNSGRYFDSKLLSDGFSLIYARDNQTINISGTSKNEVLALKKGEILVIPEVYKLEFSSPESSFFKIKVSRQFLIYTDHSALKEDAYRCECHPISESRQSLLNLFREFQASYKKEGVISRFRTDSLLKLLIADLLDMADGHRNDDSLKRKGRESYNNLIHFVSKNFHLPFDANQISERLGLSVQYLNSLANDFRSMSLKEMVNFYRLEMSREKLVESSLSISEAASECGFTGAAYFIKIFKKTYGITPLQCRKKLQQRKNEKNKDLHKVLNFEMIEGQQEVPLISLEHSKRVTMVIANTRDTVALISWLYSSAPELEMIRLKPGQRIHLGTRCGECWSVRSESGELRAYYSVPDSCCQAIL
jgi:AraC family transcriptional regulator, arabinose operon regulatory protein